MSTGCASLKPSIAFHGTLALLVLFFCGCLGLGAGSAQAQPLQQVQSLALGDAFSCALSEVGEVSCWGLGMLGDGSRTISREARPLSGLERGVRRIAANATQVCAVGDTRSVVCWSEGTSPTLLLGLSGVEAVGLGIDRACALMDGGVVRCWAPNSPSADLVPGLSGGATALAVGGDHACAIVWPGAVRCWGDNSQGQVGGVAGYSVAAVEVPWATLGIVGIAAGKRHTCALDQSGKVLCWGAGIARGNGGTGAQPVTPAGLEQGVSMVTAGDDYSCAITAHSRLKCWGMNDQGQLGDGTYLARVTPVDTVLQQPVKSVALGTRHACAVLENGSAQCWGDDRQGQLGNRSSPPQQTSLASAVNGLAEGVAALSAGHEHTCALAQGTVKCWGGNDFGALGTGDDSTRVAPTPVVGLTGAQQAVSAGQWRGCALSVAGEMKCWGVNWWGIAGDGGHEWRPTAVPVFGLGQGVRGMSLGHLHTCALTDLGEVFCWGNNAYGSVGDGSGIDRNLPVKLTALGGGNQAIVSGYGHTCALTANKGVKCWGFNQYGQLGDGSVDNRLLPVSVSGMESGVRALASGEHHVCALREDAQVWCWGSSEFGQLGNGSLGSATVPSRVSGLNGTPQAIAAGLAHTCALTVGGQVQCWGNNLLNQLGIADASLQTTPTPATGLNRAARALTLGGAHTCIIDEANTALCWGANYSGQLGNGVSGARPYPLEVMQAVPVNIVEFYNAQLRHYFITGGTGEIAGIEAGAAGAGWSRTGGSFKAYAPENGIAPGALPVCRFYGTPGLGPNSHFYTVDPIECELVKRDRGWSYEGTAFYVFPPANGQCAASQQPVYRAYNMRFAQNDSNHRYTTDSATYAQMLAQGWAGEGVKFCGAP